VLSVASASFITAAAAVAVDDGNKRWPEVSWILQHLRVSVGEFARIDLVGMGGAAASGCWAPAQNTRFVANATSTTFNCRVLERSRARASG